VVLNCVTEATSIEIFMGFINNQCKKTGTDYLDLEPGNKF